MTHLGRRLALAFVLAGALLALIISPASSYQPPTPSSQLAMILLAQGADSPSGREDAACGRAQDQAQPQVAEEPDEDVVFPPAPSPSHTAGPAAHEVPKTPPAKPAAKPSVNRGPNAPKPATSTSDGRLIRMRVTAYCPCLKCCGRDSTGLTASGNRVGANGSRFVAADTRLLPFRTKVSIPGYSGGSPVPVLDTGSAIKGRRLDVFFPSHSQAQRWGSRWLSVRVHTD